MSNESMPIDDESFEEKVLKSPVPVLVDFWAPWCAPCRLMGPLMKKLAEEFEGRLLVTRLNVGPNPITPAKYSIRAIPTLIIFKGGKEVYRRIGALPWNILEEEVEGFL